MRQTGNLAETILHIEQALREHMLRYGYRVMRVPLIEPAELFLTRAGDQIAERLFTFELRGTEFALRPEFTAAAAHLYATQKLQEAVRWQFAGAIFEDDRSGDVQDYQRYSIGAEFIGQAGAAADAEMITMAAHGALALGVQGSKLVTGHVGLLRHLLQQFDLDTRTAQVIVHHRSALRDPERGRSFVLEQVERLLGGGQQAGTDRLLAAGAADEVSTEQMLNVLLDTTRSGATMGGRTRSDIARRLLDKRKRSAEYSRLVAALDFLEAWIVIDGPAASVFPRIENLLREYDDLTRQILHDWQRTIELVYAAGVPEDMVMIQPDLARNWDYYTGVVFGLRAQSGRYICGGGRYDELVQLIGGRRSVPAVGFAYYLDVLLQENGLHPQGAVRVVQLSCTDETVAFAMRWAHLLRQNGLAVVLTQAGGDAAAVSTSGELVLDKQLYTPDKIETLVHKLKDGQ